MKISPLLLLGVGAVLMMVVALVLIVVDGRKKAKQTRIDAALRAYTPAAKNTETKVARNAPATAVTPGEQESPLTRFLLVRPSQPDLYPLPWWLIMLGIGIGATVGAGLLSAVFGEFAWLGQPVLWTFGARMVFGIFASKRARKLYTQMPDALAMIVRSVRTGIPVPEALRIVGKEAQAPTAVEFERLYNQILIGQSLSDALVQMAKRTEVPEYRFFAVALSLQGQTGGSLTDTLENLGDVIRKRTAMRARAYALSSEARTTMMVLASLPFIAFTGLLLLSPNYVMLLIDSQRGRQILAAAIISLLMGIGTMQLMIRRALT